MNKLLLVCLLFIGNLAYGQSVPTLTSPDSGSAGVSTSPTFSWNASVIQNPIYTLQVWTPSVLDTMAVSNVSPGYTISGLSNGTLYYWQVIESNSSGSDTSLVWSFTTKLAPPILLSPANNSTGVSISPTLTWSASTGATSYELQISTVPTFATTFKDTSSIAITSATISGLSNDVLYYWRVIASNAGGTDTSTSSPWNFTTIVAAPASPILSSPTSGSTGVSISPKLTWNTSAGATSYTLEVSTSSGFATLLDSIVLAPPTNPDTSTTISGLSNNTLYYWRVLASNVGGASPWSSVWNFTTIVAPPPPPILSSPTNGETGVSISPTLKWNSAAGATSYTLEVSISSGFATLLDSIVLTPSTNPDTSTTISGLSNGTLYYWRVIAGNLGGSDTSGVWNFTTIVAAPPPPTLSSPTNGATGVSISPTLTWKTDTGATTYRLQVSTLATFGSTIKDTSGITATSATINGLSNSTLYYWRVIAGNLGGSDTSSVWNFTTIVAAPASPILSSPTSGSTGVSISPKLTWNTSAGATSYTLEVSTSSGFATLLDSIVLAPPTNPDTSTTISGLSNNTLYYWRVLASNVGGASPWSSVWNFTTIVAAPPAPSLSSPVNGTNSVSTSLTLKWNASGGAASYRLQISTDPAFATTFYDQSNLTSTSQGISGLANSTEYYWRVDASNAGGTSGWSSVWNFTTVVAASSVPVLSSPSNGETGVSINPTLTWIGPSGATSYGLQVSTDSTFATMVYNQSNLTSTSQVISGLNNNTKYYWQVNASNSGGTSGWSSVWYFITIAAVPSTPTPSSPANGSNGVSISPKLTWNASAGATNYTLEVSTNSSFISAVDSIVTTDSSAAITGLSSNTEYYWRVNASNAGGTSGWSNTWNFTTIIATPASPTLSTPSNGATGVSINPTLTWTASIGAATYRLQVSTDSTFATTSYDQSNITSTSQSPGKFAGSTKYYWRVDATNATGTSNWSSIWSFTTASTTSSVPILSSPIDGATGVPTSLPLSWIGPSGATSYTLQVSTDSTFATTFYSQSNLAYNSQIVNGLANNTKYYWRVSAGSGEITSGWSSVWYFTTIGASFSVPMLYSPLNGSIGLPIKLTLSWNAVSGATFYRLQVSTDSSFSTTTYDSSVITGTSKTIDSLSNQTKYYWRVNAGGVAGTSGWSSVWNFTTILAAPLLSTPTTGSDGMSTNPTMTWIASIGATSYRLQVSTDSTFAVTFYDHSNITSVSDSLSKLANNTKYYWRVAATNSGGTSSWSSVWNFTTVVAVPALVSPQNDSTEVATRPILKWNSSTGAVSYELQISSDSSFAAVGLDILDTTTIIQPLGSLSRGTTYYWRVKANSPNGPSDWSEIWKFTTFTYSSTIQVSTQFTPPGTMGQAGYRIIGLPGAIDIPLSGILSGKQGTNWDAYYDNGDSSNYQVEYDGSSLFNFEPGRALWILTDNQFSISQNVTAVPLDSIDGYSIPLHDGWNLISNPFQKSVSWESIQTLNDVVQPIYSFNGQYNTSVSFDPYTGYYFYNDQNLASLEIPYVYGVTSQNKSEVSYSKVSSIQNCNVEITFSTKKTQALPIRVGFNLELPDSSNRLNIFAPPDNFDDFRIQIVDQNVRGYWKKLYSDFTNEIGSGKSFDVEVKNLTGDNAKIKTMLAGSFGIYNVFLVDDGTHTFYDLKATDSILISGAYKHKSFSLVIGNDGYIDSLRAVYIPRSYELYQNYPNPFNPVTIIRYEIPKKAEVVLKVYNVLGQLVRTLVDQVQQSGYYEVPFDGSGLASGVYFSRMNAGSFSQVRKMVMIK